LQKKISVFNYDCKCTAIIEQVSTRIGDNFWLQFNIQ